MTEVSGSAHAAAERVARQSYGRLVAYLSARTRDVAAAEDALAEAFAEALRRWPSAGVPASPEAWLLAVARRRAVDAVRRNRTRDAAQDHLKLMVEEAEAEATMHDLPDDRLRLMFACAHPAIAPGMRAPLILQTVLGFDAATIASAFLVAPATMGQRLVRAKARIRDAGIPFRVPEAAELGDRLAAVLEAVYATYAEGWSDAAGTDSLRRNLAGEGIWLGRLIASLMPQEPEALSLLALMLYAESRRGARRDGGGEYIALGDQDMALWNAAMIEEADTMLDRAGKLDGLGRYQLEAAIQSAHIARRVRGDTDWSAIRLLYRALCELTGSPVAKLNLAVATAEIDGPQPALTLLDHLADDPRLAAYQPYWAARAGLLAKLGRQPEARGAYDRAIGLERDEAVRRFLQKRRGELG